MNEPVQVADLAIGAAIQTGQPVYLEPAPGQDCYLLRIDHEGVESVVSPSIGRAAVARLALIAGLDLAGDHPASGRVPIRCGTASRTVLVTVRHGDALRADLVVLPTFEQTAEDSSADPQIGERIGNYTVADALGYGGMGVVYRVVHASLDRTYALKMLLPDVIERDPDAAEQFLREARLASRIRHPNIVDVFDFGYAKRRPYLVMELITGRSLGSRVDDRNAMPPGEVLAIARQLASALAAAHAAGVVHADVTPSNMLVTADNTVKLLDFGLARLHGDRTVDSEYVMGTPAYISPEQLRGGAATEHSDQYGLGATLFHLLTGAPPFQHAEVRQICQMHLQAPVPPVISPHGPLPPRLAELVTRCLEKSPASRFSDLRAVLAAIEEIERVAQRSDWTRWLSR